MPFFFFFFTYFKKGNENKKANKFHITAIFGRDLKIRKLQISELEQNGVEIYRNDFLYSEYILLSPGLEEGVLIKPLMTSALVTFFGQSIIYLLLALLFFL